jgi:hypothetical protein
MLAAYSNSSQRRPTNSISATGYNAKKSNSNEEATNDSSIKEFRSKHAIRLFIGADKYKHIPDQPSGSDDSGEIWLMNQDGLFGNYTRDVPPLNELIPESEEQ